MARRGWRRPPRLGRRPASRNPKAKMIIVCEGRVTEPLYLSSFARHCGAYLGVDLVLEGGAGVPLSVVRRARQLFRESTSEFSERDQAWAVFDRDAHPGFEQAINEAGAGSISVAYSNPCFELWLVLHMREHDSPVQRAEIQRILQGLMPAYDPKKSKRVDFFAISDAVEVAERRAEVMDRRRANEGAPRGNPSCTVYKLTREIRKQRPK